MRPQHTIHLSLDGIYEVVPRVNLPRLLDGREWPRPLSPPIRSSLQPRMDSPAPRRPLCPAVGKKGRWLSWREPPLCPLSSTLTTQRKWTHLAAISSVPGPPCHYWKSLFPRRLAKSGAETAQTLCLLALNHHLTSESVEKQPLVHLTGGSSQLKGKLAGHSLLRGLCHVLVAHSGLPLPPPPIKGV